MAKLTLHFSKFGNVVNVQMRPNFKCAFVQYATEEEAKKAFHSPIPVCNNRFIEVKWAKYDPQDPLGAPSMTEQEAEGQNENGSSSSLLKKHMTTEELRAAALEKGRKVLEEKRELLEKQKQLTKQKEELLKRQLAQQKEILERMSQSGVTVSVDDKRELLNKITALSEELKALQRGSGLPVPSAAAAASSSVTGDLIGLKEELSALEAQTAGIAIPTGGKGTGGRGERGRWVRGGRMSGGRIVGGRIGGGRGALTLDNRTTIVLVEKLPEEARDASVLEQHFGKFGQLDKVILDEKNPEQAFIKFHDRYSGQTAQTYGSMYGTSKLEMKWIEPLDAPEALATTITTTPPELTPTSASTTDKTANTTAAQVRNIVTV
jgi:RNA-binding protein 26